MAVVMGRLDGDIRTRNFCIPNFLESTLSGRAGGGIMSSGRHAFDPRWVEVVFGLLGERRLDHLCGYSLLEEKGVFPRDMGGCSSTCCRWSSIDAS